jgi:two-component system nitrogen regulation sensor histidine kinase GlnL
MNDATTRGWAEPLATGVALADAQLRLLWVNPALAELLAVGPRSAVGQSLAVLLHRPEWMALAERALREPSPLQLRGIEVPSARDDSERMDVSMQPLASGELLLEVHALAPPAPSDAPLSATLRGFAHEVKNPLAGLRGAAQLLHRRVHDEDLRSLAGLVIAEADRLTALANRLLHHGGAAQLGPVNIHERLERLGDLLSAEPSAPKVRHDYDPSLPDIYGEADRLLQLLLNLARNAIEAGAATLTFRTRAEPALRLGERTARMALRVDVIDDGPGVSPSLRDTLFEPLVSGRADGTGLGLALAREIAREHGGELRYASRPGETVFSLYLPMGHAHD